MQPSPVSVENDFTVVGSAGSSCRASLPSQGWMDFRCQGTDLLGMCEARKKRNEGDSRRHLDDGCSVDALDVGLYTVDVQLIYLFLGSADV